MAGNLIAPRFGSGVGAEIDTPSSSTTNVFLVAPMDYERRGQKRHPALVPAKYAGVIATHCGALSNLYRDEVICLGFRFERGLGG